MLDTRERRSAYLTTLAEWQPQVGKAAPRQEGLPDRAALMPLDERCQTAWQSSLDQVAEFQQRPSNRPSVVARRPPAPGP